VLRRLSKICDWKRERRVTLNLRICHELSRQGRVVCAISVSGRETSKDSLRAVREGSDVPVAICKRLTTQEPEELPCLVWHPERTTTTRRYSRFHIEPLQQVSSPLDEALSTPQLGMPPRLPRRLAGRIWVTCTSLLIAFIVYSSQLCIIYPWYGSELSVDLLLLLGPFK
jgi:hypothetical protein